MATNSFEKEIAIIVAMNRITGVRTFHHSNRWFWLLLSFLYKLILMISLIYVLSYMYQMITKNMFNYLTYVTYIFTSVFCVACVNTIQVLGWLNYKEMSQLRKNIAETDRNLMKLNVVVDQRTVSSFIIIVCVSHVFAGVAYFLIYLYGVCTYSIDTNYILSDVTFCAMSNVGVMVLLDFAVHVCWLRSNFKRTNDLLRKFFIEECQMGTEEWNNETVSSWLERCLNGWHTERISRRSKIIPYNGTQIMKRQLYPMNKISMLQQIRYVHLQLCVITKSLKKIFSMQLMCHSSATTLTFVVVLYDSYTVWVDGPKLDNLGSEFLCLYVVDAFYVWLKVAAVCLLCENIDKETKQVAQILQVLSIHNSDFELQHELVQFSVQISLSELDNKRPRLFPLNYMFIVQSIGATLTYFLVMIQWNQALNVISSFTSNSTVTSTNSYNDTMLADQLIENQPLI